MAWEPGGRVAGYQLLEPIGTGGMAQVWMARPLRQGLRHRVVALKVLHSHLSGSERYLEMMRAEVKLASSLCHANIVAVLDTGTSCGRPFVAMEWVDGVTLVKLRELIAAQDAMLRDRLVAYIVGQLLHAVAYAHERRDESGARLEIVHRDISPQNVLIGANGDVKLIDFGVAHTTNEETSGLHVKGKLRYMAPEYLHGALSHAGLDLYAVGALLHELASGEVYRAGVRGEEDLYRAAVSGEIPALDVALAPELEALRVALLAPNPADRPASAVEALERLEAWSGYRDARRLLAAAAQQVRPSRSPAPPMRVEPSTVETTKARWAVPTREPTMCWSPTPPIPRSVISRPVRAPLGARPKASLWGVSALGILIAVVGLTGAGIGAAVGISAVTDAANPATIDALIERARQRPYDRD